MEKQPIIGKTLPALSSSSSPEVAVSNEFDVFLSFRGPDVRKKFTSHLYDRLRNAGFRVYLDEKEMNKGEKINEDLKKAIVNSRICMPIFSKNYASSKACLHELSHMVYCKNKIIPIFYDATPNDVKLKTQLYKKHLEDHRHNPNVGLDEVDKWEKALITVAEISGYELLDKNEAEEITSITQALIIQLMPKHQNMTNKLVEMESEVKCVEELLDLGSSGSRIVGIYGMGGIGKTTLAKAIFNQLSSCFSGCCSFIENVRENLQCKKLLKLQRQLYKDIMNPSNVDSIKSSNDGMEMIRKGFENKKALIILDDMNDGKQLTDLLGHHIRLTSGTRLIITTRDRKVLDDLNQEYKNVLIYELNELDGDRALKLFSKYAFMQDSPPKGFERLSNEVVSYTGGLPLALEIFGSSLYGSSKDTWKEILEELKKFPSKSIETRLMISYHGLRNNEQKIFLDIACYYGKLDKRYACYMWEDYCWYPKSAMRTLEERCLIKIIIIDGDEVFWMHDVLKDFGRALIEDEADKSGKIPRRLRLDNRLDILHETKEKGHVETLIIDSPTITITREGMVGLQNLRFLELRVHEVKGDFNGLFPNLRWFICRTVKEFKPINFGPKKLVILQITSLRIKWKGKRRIKADKLKALELGGISARSFGIFQPVKFNWILNATNLEKLKLIRRRNTVSGLEEMGKLSQITDLYLWGVKFKYPPHIPSTLLRLDLIECEFIDGTLDVSNLKTLTHFRIIDPKKLNEIKGRENLYSLEVLILNGLNNTRNLKELEVARCETLKELPDVSCLERLSSSILWPMERIVSFSGLESLTWLALHLCSAVEIMDLSTLRRLRTLRVWRCKKLSCIQGIPHLESLETVEIGECASVELCPSDFTKLESVRSLYITNCPKLPCIDKKSFDANFIDLFNDYVMLGSSLRQISLSKNQDS